VPARLASLLVQLLGSEGVVGQAVTRYPALTHSYEELGTMIGVKRVAVTRTFKRLREEGALEVERRWICIADLRTLERIAEQER
jgi:CRP-like cAMP-binding protein